MKKIMSMLLAFLILVSFAIAPGVNAAENSEELISKEIIEIVNPYVKVTEESFKLTNVKELKGKISKKEFKQVKEQIKQSNIILKENNKLSKVNEDTFLYEINDLTVKEELEAGGYEYDLEKSTSIEYKSSSNFEVESSGWDYNGYNRLYVKWWGVEVWLSKTTVANILAGTVAAGAVLLGIILPGIGWAIGIAVSSFIIGAIAAYNAKPIVVGVNWAGKIKYSYFQTP